MMYPRLELLRDLLSEDGSIWVTIDENEGHYLKVIMDEIISNAQIHKMDRKKRCKVEKNATIKRVQPQLSSCQSENSGEKISDVEFRNTNQGGLRWIYQCERI